MADIAALKAELTSDPLIRGYVGMSDEAAAASLNVVDRVRDRASMSASEVFNAISPVEFEAIAEPKYQQEVWNILHLGEINPFGLEATRFSAIFGAGSVTITALKALRKTDVSRAVERDLGVVWPGEVAQARAYHG